jgi:hypothetical protein
MADPERMQEALEQIVQWSEAYPPSIFSKPDWPRVAEVLHAAGLSLDAVSADCMRHCVKGVGEIARKGLGDD